MFEKKIGFYNLNKLFQTSIDCILSLQYIYDIR